jgi:Ca2+-binding RTX toxin-like protein
MSNPIITVVHTPANEGLDGFFVVRLDRPATEAVQIDYRIFTGDGAGSLERSFLNFRVNDGQVKTVTINPGETSATIKILTNDDSIDRPDLSYSLELFNLQGAEFAGGGTILRTIGIALDDDGGTSPAVVVGAPVVVEGDAGTQLVRFEVKLSRPLSSSTTVQYTTLDGSATAGSDYVAKSGSLTFAAGETSAFVDVVIKGDTAREASESFSLKITPPTAAPAIQSTLGTATILNDDTVNDVPSVSVVHMAGNEGKNGVFVLRLDRPAIEAVQMQFRVVTGNGAGSLDLSALGSSFEAGNVYTVTIDPGQTTASIRVDTDDDNIDRPDLSYSLELFDLQGAEFAGGGTILRTTGIVLDDDSVANNRVAVGQQLVQFEGAANRDTIRFEIKLSRPAATDTVLNYNTLDGTALAGQNYIARSGSVTIQAGATSGFVTIRLLDGAVNDAGKTFTLAVKPVSFGSTYHIGAIIQPRNTYGTNNGESIVGTAIDDVIFGLGGNDTITGLGGKDYLNGGAGNDQLLGGIGNDTLLGAAGRDTLLGGSGGDTLNGGDSADSLRGGTGRDQLIGGTGADRFIFGPGEAAGIPGATNDRIRDFSASEGDKIDLRLIDARTNMSGDQAFVFIGKAAFSKVAGQLRFETISGNTYVSGDMNGDGIADIAIRVDGVVALAVTDFLL